MIIGFMDVHGYEYILSQAQMFLVIFLVYAELKSSSSYHQL